MELGFPRYLIKFDPKKLTNFKFNKIQIKFI